MPPIRDVLGSTQPDTPLGGRLAGRFLGTPEPKIPGKEVVKPKWHQSKAFPNIGPMEMEVGVTERMRKPDLIDQDISSLCGPSVLMYHVARTSATAYETYCRNLYHDGIGTLGENLVVKPGHDCRHVRPQNLNAADWVALASLRDSENAVFDYDDEDDQIGGITLPSTLAGWMRKVGAGTVINETNVYLTKGEDNLRQANQLHRLDRSVCLFIRATAVEHDNLQEQDGRFALFQPFTIPNHWVALTSEIQFRPDGRVTFNVFTWGEIRTVGPIPIGVWLENYYGFVACRL